MADSGNHPESPQGVGQVESPVTMSKANPLIGAGFTLIEFQTPRKNSWMGTFTTLAIRSKASMEMIFSPRSISPIYFGFKSAASANFSCVKPAFLRFKRIASPMIFLCRNIGFPFFFGFATSEDCRERPEAYTSNMLVFFDLLSVSDFLRKRAGMNQKANEHARHSANREGAGNEMRSASQILKQAMR